MRVLNPLSSSSLRSIARNLFGSSLPQTRKNGNLCSSAAKGHRLSSLVETISEYEKDQPRDDAKVKAKRKTLHFALYQLSGGFDKESNLSMHRFFGTRSAAVISTGSLNLDLALGIGGLPKGRMVEIYGKEASGKTTLALHIMKEAQKLGGYCAYLDVENAMDPSLAEAMGVNTEKLVIVHPNSAENSLCIVNELVKSNLLDVIVVDTVAALAPKCELDGLIDIHSKDVQSRLMTQALRKIQASLSQSQTLIVFVNQVRTNTRSNQQFGQANEVACGGNALRFYAAIRMRTTRRALLYTEDEVTGINIGVEVVKNKLSPTTKNVSLDIEFGRGISREAEILEFGCRYGILKREGSGFWIKGMFFKDQKKAEQYLDENNEVSDDFVSIIRDHVQNDILKADHQDVAEADDF